MNSLNPSRCALNVCIAVVLLAGCGRSMPSVGTSAGVAQGKQSVSFNAAASRPARRRVTVLYRFGGSPDAAIPTGTLIADKHGNLYGTSYGGGTHSGCGTDDGCGTVFELKPSVSGYSERVIWSFGGSGDGQTPGPGSKLVADAAGALYGTTTEGGANGQGIVFKLTPSGQAYREKVLYSFCTQNNCADGGEPYAGLTLDATGALYGTTTGYSSPFLYGNVFKLTPSGRRYVESVIWNFNGDDGLYPQTPLIEDSSGSLYGTTNQGSTYNSGTIFKLTPHRNKYSEQVLQIFNGQDGGPRASGLFKDGDGSLYGTAFFGGPSECLGSSCGTAFKLTPSGTSYTEHVLLSFDQTDGFWPYSGLIKGKDGVLYGTTWTGGPNACPVVATCGRIFKLTPSGSTYIEHIIWNFNAGDGFSPGPLIFGPSGDLYGWTSWGGAKTTCHGSAGCGTIFKVSIR